MPESTPQTIGPIIASERIVALDVLRGFALFGIFLVNIQLFGLPLADMLRPLHEGTAEFLGWALIRTFCELKFVTLFSLLFGMGMAVQLRRADERGTKFAFLYFRRLALLACFGLVHALGLWYGDILFIYAGCGLGLLILFRLSWEWLLFIGVGLLAFGLVVNTLFEFAEAWGHQQQEKSRDASEPQAISRADLETKPWATAWNELKACEGNPTDTRFAALERRVYAEGPPEAALAVRAVTWGCIALVVPIFFAPRTLGIFLLGAVLLQTGFFTASRRRWQWGFAIVGVGLGLGLEILSTWIVASSPAGESYRGAWGETIHHFASVILALGYVGVVTLILRHPLMLRLSSPIGAVGRMALTNYILQTIVATTTMYWWGWGQFGSWDRPGLVLFVIVVYVIQVTLSTVYLRSFSIGPLEWLWRSLTYLRPVPWRIKSPYNAAPHSRGREGEA